MNALLSYQFDDAPVRVVMRDDEPWFVAADLAAVLGYRDAPNMCRMLEADELHTHNVSTSAGEREHSIISESGMYAVVLKSRRSEAKRFRRWVTGDVLPSLRKTGQYAMPDGAVPAHLLPADFDPVRLTASVGVVREARRLFGPSAARAVWAQLGLPHCIADADGSHDPFADDLRDWLNGQSEATIDQAARGIGLRGEIDRSTRYRIGSLMRAQGWRDRKVKRGRAAVNLFTPSGAAAQAVANG